MAHETLLALALAVLIVALASAWQRLAAAEEQAQVPIQIDSTGQFVLLPIEWFKALIDTHNEHVEQIRKLMAEQCS